MARSTPSAAIADGLVREMVSCVRNGARAKCSCRKLRLENYGAAMKSRVFCAPPTPRRAPRDGLPRASRDLTGKTQESRRAKSEPSRLTRSEQIQSKLRSLRL